MSLTDVANRVLYETARERDRFAWIADAQRKWRDALMRGEDDRRALSVLVLRKNEVQRARERDATASSSTEQGRG